MERKGLHPDLVQKEFSLDDLVFPPQRLPDFERSQVDLTSKVTKKLTLKTPIFSSPMDTVTGAEMAILLAQIGGIGVIHYNFHSLEDQMREVEKVRKFEAGFVRNPKVIGPKTTLSEIRELAGKFGFSSFPVTQDGTLETPLIGMVTNRDVRYQEDENIKAKKLMTGKEKLVVARKETTLDKNNIKVANAIIRKNNLDTLPIVDEDSKVVALVTDSDLKKNDKFPNATKDENKQLKVLIAVESRLDLITKDRIKAAESLGVSGIVIDARQIYREHLKIAKFIKKETGMDVILGNLVTHEAAMQVLNEAGKYVDAFRVGIGGGEVCITTETTGIGRSLGSALFEVGQAVKDFKNSLGHIGLIADGGIKNPYHIIGSLALGADAVMMGSYLAGFLESPTDEIFDQSRQMMVKKVRGMGSIGAITERAGAHRYMTNLDPVGERFAEGIEKTIPFMESGRPHLNRLFNGVRTTFQGLGFKNIEDLRENIWITPKVTAASKGTF